MFLSGKGMGSRCQCLALAMLALAWLGATAAQSQAFCTTKVIHDYKAPLAGLPPLPSPPINERLPFAPPRVFFRSLGAGALQVGAGARGYRLSFSPYEASEQSPTLDWKLTSTLTPINEAGQPLAPPQTIEHQVDKLEPESGRDSGEMRIEFPIPRVPMLYRLEIRIENGNGELLGTFGEYFRALEPSVDFHLSLNKKRFKPGQTLRATLSNPGVAWLSFGLYLSIQYKKGKSWVDPPVEFPGGIVPAVGLGMGPGESRSCWKVEIPENTVPGRYRFTTRVGVSTTIPLLPRLGNRRTLKAGFTVLPPPPRKAFAIAPPVPHP